MKRTPSPEALAAVPTLTLATWPKPYPIGHRHTATTGAGRPRWCLVGCRTNGGPVAPWHCPRCRSDHRFALEWGLRRLDQLVGGR